MVSVVILVVAGVGAGIINTIAGAGALLLLPALITAGLTMHEANGSMRAAIIAAGLSATFAFSRQKLLTRAAVLRVVPPALIGAVAGAATATQLASEVLEPIMVGTMLLVVASAMRPPRVAPLDRQSCARWVETIGLLAAGYYGGMLQVGVGLLLLMVLVHFSGYDFVVANALKVVTTLVFNVAAFAVFAGAGDVQWRPAGLVAAGALVGGAIGAKVAIRAEGRWTRVVVIVIGLIAAITIAVR